MPQNANAAKQHAGQKGKKKKGRAPAHQNKFAFKHNPKSKTTEKILAMPIFHVCQRCHDKLEWRKQYRKYKPRTQPGTCNGCRKRNVKAAYHTICEACTMSSDKAKEVIQEARPPNNNNDNEEEDEDDLPKMRACAICVKELALPDPADEEEDELAQAAGRIRLRELKTLERQLEREAKQSNKPEGDDEEGGDKPELDGDDDDSDQDEFLQAVGGADKLLTGEAYQKKLLEQQTAN